MQTFSVLATVLTALGGSAVALPSQACPPGPIRPDGVPGCPSGQFICAYELRDTLRVYTEEQLGCLVENSQADPSQINIDGLYQCTTTDPIWIHACNNESAVPDQGKCQGRSDPGPIAMCRFGPPN